MHVTQTPCPHRKGLQRLFSFTHGPHSFHAPGGRNYGHAPHGRGGDFDEGAVDLPHTTNDPPWAPTRPPISICGFRAWQALELEPLERSLRNYRCSPRIYLCSFFPLIHRCQLRGKGQELLHFKDFMSTVKEAAFHPPPTPAPGRLQIPANLRHSALPDLKSPPHCVSLTRYKSWGWLSHQSTGQGADIRPRRRQPLPVTLDPSLASEEPQLQPGASSQAASVATGWRRVRGWADCKEREEVPD